MMTKVLIVLLLLGVVLAGPGVSMSAPALVETAEVNAQVYFNIRCDHRFEVGRNRPLLNVPVIALSGSASSTALTRWPQGNAYLTVNALATSTVKVELPATLGAFNLEPCFGDTVEIAPTDWRGVAAKWLYIPFEVTISKPED